MVDNIQTAANIAQRRKAKGLTQEQVAGWLHVSPQAVSKWEKGHAFPGIDLFFELAKLLDTTIDALLGGDGDAMTYNKAGADVASTDSIKEEMRDYMLGSSPRVLNSMGAFASLYDIHFNDLAHPVLVLKAGVPGSKQKLAIEYGYTEAICHDMVNHLVNDIAVMGASPMAVLDTIVCGSAEKDTITTLVKGIAAACKQNDCALVGGEASVQPGVLDKGRYLFTASIAGIVDKAAIMDGSKIREGDMVLGVASNGLHTNGYSQMRTLMQQAPALKQETVEGESFLDAIMRPHAAYYKVVSPYYHKPSLHGMAHITGGGLQGNLPRILPKGLGASIDLAAIKIPRIFKLLKAYGHISDAEMLRTFNCGVGLVLVVHPSRADAFCEAVSEHYACYPIGRIGKSDTPVTFTNVLNWD